MPVIQLPDPVTHTSARLAAFDEQLAVAVGASMAHLALLAPLLASLEMLTKSLATGVQVWPSHPGMADLERKVLAAADFLKLQGASHVIIDRFLAEVASHDTTDAE